MTLHHIFSSSPTLNRTKICRFRACHTQPLYDRAVSADTATRTQNTEDCTRFSKPLRTIRFLGGAEGRFCIIRHMVLPGRIELLISRVRTGFPDHWKMAARSGSGWSRTSIAQDFTLPLCHLSFRSVWCPCRDSNPVHGFRRPVHYPIMLQRHMEPRTGLEPASLPVRGRARFPLRQRGI